MSVCVCVSTSPPPHHHLKTASPPYHLLTTTLSPHHHLITSSLPHHHLITTSLPHHLGWLTLGSELTSSNYHKENYLAYFQKEEDLLLGTREEIENLRPKTPPLKTRGTGRGRGMGRGGMARGGGGGGIQTIGRSF